MNLVSQHNQLSYDVGLCKEPLIGCTLTTFFEQICDAQPDAIAVVDRPQKITWTYSQLRSQVDSLARGLMHFGIQRGERVGIWSTNNAQWTVTQLAASKVGGILVNINPAYKPAELEFVLRHSGVKLLVVIPGHRTSNYLEMLAALKPSLFAQTKADENNPDGAAHAMSPGTTALSAAHSSAAGLPLLEQIVVIADNAPDGLITFGQLQEKGSAVKPADLEIRADQLQFDDALNIQYTSGTTGLPKGVTLSHHNLLNNGWLAAQAMGLTADSRFCIPMPFYHCGGMISASLATLTAGGTIVIPSAFFDAESVLSAIQDERCSHLCGVPTMFISELQHPDFERFDLSSLRGGFLAGAPCPVQLMREVADKMHMEQVVILYGLTEASPLMTATTVEDSLEIRATTVGRVIPGIEIKVIDAVTSQLLPRGKQGEICSRGHGVMLGYWENPTATKDAIDAAGWLRSGDLGVMSEVGLINITGRKKDMLIRGGENIYPREIEEVLHEHRDVAQAQVFGIPDAKLGEEAVVWLMLKPNAQHDAEQIMEWLKTRIAYYKVPSHVKVVTEFPMTVTGKIQKFVMRETMIAELGLRDAAEITTA